jgi:hypothetical protein
VAQVFCCGLPIGYHDRLAFNQPRRV